MPGQTSRISDHRHNADRRFNGGPSNCPAKPLDGRLSGEPRQLASMEGRAIARPNVGLQHPCTGLSVVASMEGRAIARAKPARVWTSTSTSSSLQWRAEQLPGQTQRVRRSCRLLSSCFNGGPSNCPAKPPPPLSRSQRAATSFNGGPSNCPAKPGSVVIEVPPRLVSFNGGPSNCPAKLAPGSLGR